MTLDACISWLLKTSLNSSLSVFPALSGDLPRSFTDVPISSEVAYLWETPAQGGGHVIFVTYFL